MNEKILGTESIPGVGGDQLTQALADYFREQIRIKYGEVNLSERADRRIVNASERAKKVTLSPPPPPPLSPLPLFVGGSTLTHSTDSL